MSKKEKKNRGRDKAMTDMPCAELRPDDGVPPVVLAKERRDQLGRKVPWHRPLQLCRQVEQALAASLCCDTGDPRFSELSVESVRPSTGSTVLLVTLRAETQDPVEIDALQEALEGARGFLRAAVGGAIHRKRVPQLQFRVLPG